MRKGQFSSSPSQSGLIQQTKHKLGLRCYVGQVSLTALSGLNLWQQALMKGPGFTRKKGHLVGQVLAARETPPINNNNRQPPARGLCRSMRDALITPKTEAVAEITRPPSSFSIAPGQWFRGPAIEYCSAQTTARRGLKSGSRISSRNRTQVQQVGCGACGHEEIRPTSLGLMARILPWCFCQETTPSS